MKLKIKGLFVLALSIFNAAQSQGITNNAIPNWVKLHELPSDSNSRVISKLLLSAVVLRQIHGDS